MPVIGDLAIWRLPSSAWADPQNWWESDTIVRTAYCYQYSPRVDNDYYIDQMVNIST